MRNAIALLLVLAIGALGTLVYTQESTIRQQEQSVQQLTAQLQASRTTITAASLEPQEKCAKQAREVFNCNVNPLSVQLVLNPGRRVI